MRWTYLKLVATVFFWGSNFAVGKVVVQSLAPASASFMRFVIGTLGLFVAYYASQGAKWPQLNRRQWLLIFLSGFSGAFLYNLCFFEGMKHITAVRASLLVTSTSVFVALLSAWLFREKLTWLKWLGIVLSIVGTCVVIVRGDFSLILSGSSWGLGESLIMGCVLSWTAYTLLGKVILQEVPALTLSVFSSLFGSLLLFFPAWHEDLPHQISHITWQAALAVAYIGITATTLGYVWYYDAVRQLGASKAAVVGNLTPVFAVLVAVVGLGEHLGLLTACGGGVVLLGVWLMNKK